MQHWWVRLIPVVLALVVAAGTAVGSAVSARAESEELLRVAVTTSMNELNPLLATSPAAQMILHQQYERVVGRGLDDELVPGLAAQWAVSGDGRTWTYTFPGDRVWSDGEPLTAEDAVWTVESMAGNQVLRQRHASLLDNIAEVVAPDPQTLMIILVEPQAANPGADLVVLPEHSFEATDSSQGLGLGDPQTSVNVGSGPFILAQTGSPDGSGPVEMVANPHFWRGPPRIDGVDFLPFSDTAAATQAISEGEVDLVSQLSAEEFVTLEGVPGVGTHVGVGRSYTALIINQGVQTAGDEPFGDGNEALRDRLVRQALQWSVNQDEVITQVLQGYGTPALTPVPPTYPAFSGLAAGAEPFGLDLRRANELLDQAGYLRGDQQRRIGLDGEPLSLRLLVNAEDPAQTRIAEHWQESLDLLGIDLRIEALDTDVLARRISAGEYDLHLDQRQVGPDPDPTLLENTCALRNSPGGPQVSPANYCNPEFDELYRAQHVATDPTVRAGLVREAFTISYLDAVVRPLYYPQQLEAYRSDRFSGFQPQPAQGGVIAYQSSYLNFAQVVPVLPDASPGEVARPPWSQQLRLGVILGVGLAAVALIVASALLVRRARRTNGG